MKDLDSFDRRQSRMLFSTRLTCLLSLWNHPKTVALHFASRQDFLNLSPERRDSWGCFSVREG
jgi:hypothetical protein